MQIPLSNDMTQGTGHRKANLVLYDMSGIDTKTAAGVLAEKAEATAKEKMVEAAEAASGKPMPDPPAKSVEVYVFPVQFNPSEIELLIDSDIQEPVVDLASNDEKKTTATDATATIPSVLLSMTLTFDHMTLGGSFHADIGLFTAGGALGAGLNNIQDMKETKTVQHEVEAVLSAMINPAERDLAFAWQDFFFKGKLIYASANYTMFNTDGLPVRAQVYLRISNGGNGKLVEEWMRQYKEVFKNPMVKMARANQYAANLINLPF